MNKIRLSIYQDKLSPDSKLWDYVTPVTIGDMVRVFGDDRASLEVAQVMMPQSYIDHLDNVTLDIKPEVRMGRMNRRVRFFTKMTKDGQLESKGYSYSGQTSTAYEMDDVMLELTLLINRLFGETFNGVLMNRYIDGSEYIGEHSDDETGLGNQGVFALVYGQSRTFRVREKKMGPGTNPIVFDFEPSEYVGESAFVMWMRGDFQKMYTHEVPRRMKLVNKTDDTSRVYQRTSLTWRNHVE